MKLIFLSIAVFVYGYFCDICLKICEKRAETALKKGKPLCAKGLVYMSNFAQNNLLKWQNKEKRLISLFVLERNF